MRRELPEFSDGRLDRVKVSFDEKAKWLVVRRGAVAVCCNLAGSAQRIALDGRSPQLLLASDQVRVGAESIELSAESVAIFTFTPSTVAR